MAEKKSSKKPTKKNKETYPKNIDSAIGVKKKYLGQVLDVINHLSFQVAMLRKSAKLAGDKKAYSFFSARKKEVDNMKKNISSFVTKIDDYKKYVGK